MSSDAGPKHGRRDNAEIRHASRFHFFPINTGDLPVFDSIAVVGATGAVGTLILQLLEERDLPFKKIKFLSSFRSAGKELTFKGKNVYGGRDETGIVRTISTW